MDLRTCSAETFMFSLLQLLLDLVGETGHRNAVRGPVARRVDARSVEFPFLAAAATGLFSLFCF